MVTAVKACQRRNAPAEEKQPAGRLTADEERTPPPPPQRQQAVYGTHSLPRSSDSRRNGVALNTTGTATCRGD